MTATATEIKGTDYSKMPLLRVRGLSLTRPWPWAFLNGPFPKRIENRSWKPPLSITSSHYIALHAAKSWDEDDREFFGPYGWIVSDFVALIAPVFCMGAQGLWGFENKQAELAELRRVYTQSVQQKQG